MHKWAFITVFALASCNGLDLAGKDQCRINADCLDGFTCAQERCVRVGSDGAVQADASDGPVNDGPVSDGPVSDGPGADAATDGPATDAATDARTCMMDIDCLGGEECDNGMCKPHGGSGSSSGR